MYVDNEYTGKYIRIRRLKDVLCEYPTDTGRMVHASGDYRFRAPVIPFGFTEEMLPYFGSEFRAVKQYPIRLSGNEEENRIGYLGNNNNYVWALSLIEEVVEDEKV